MTDYRVNWAREFRYDGARARYLVRDLDPVAFKTGTLTVLSETWSDYDGDTLYGDFDPGSGSSLASHEPGLWRSVGGVDDYLHSDMIGTLRMTTIGSGPSAGTPGLPRVFTAFGEKITGPQDRNGYAGAWGYQAHEEFSFQHVGARYYDPSSGRFLQRDPIGTAGGLNVYAYVFGRPTLEADPSGNGGGYGLLPGPPKKRWRPWEPPRRPRPPSPQQILEQIQRDIEREEARIARLDTTISVLRKVREFLICVVVAELLTPVGAGIGTGAAIGGAIDVTLGSPPTAK